jgi:hypothetical protein
MSEVHVETTDNGDVVAEASGARLVAKRNEWWS